MAEGRVEGRVAERPRDVFLPPGLEVWLEEQTRQVRAAEQERKARWECLQRERDWSAQMLAHRASEQATPPTSIGSESSLGPRSGSPSQHSTSESEPGGERREAGHPVPFLFSSRDSPPWP